MISRFAAARLIAVSALAISAATASAQAKWGDVNGDGAIGAVDAQAILTAVVGLPLPAGFTKVNGDANCDGTIGAVDAQIVLSYVVSLNVSQFCVGASIVGPPAQISIVAGDAQIATVGTVLATPLVMKVTYVGGLAVAGASVSWSTESGSISPTSASTDASGQSTAQWTVGKVAGNQTASAAVSGAGAAKFSATVTAGPLAKIRLAPDTTQLTALGMTAQMSVTPLDVFDNTVSGVTPTFTIDAPTIATVSGTGLLTAVANGTTTVRATSGSVAASAIVVVNIAAGTNPCTGVTMTLAVGASQTLTGSAASQFCVNGSAGAEFVAVPFYATGNGGTGSGQGTYTAPPSLLATFTPLTNTTASGPPTPSIGSDARLRAAIVADGSKVLTRDVAWEAKFRERVRKQFTPLIAEGRQRARQSPGLRRDISISPDVIVGQSMQLNVNVNQSCSNVTLVSATVKAVSTRAIVVEDDRDPANGFTSTDYQSFASVFDSQVWPVDTDELRRSDGHRQQRPHHPVLHPRGK